VVLESSDRPGGRVSSVVLDGVIVDTGAQYIGPRHPYVHTFEMIDRFGLGDAVETTSDTAALIKDGRVRTYRYGSVGDFLKLPVLSLASKLRLVAAVPDLMRHREMLDFHHLEKAASLDDQDMTDYVTALVGRDPLRRLVQPLLAVFYYYPPAGVSRAFLMAIIGSVREVGAYALRGGNQVLPERMAAGLDIIYGATVIRVKANPAGPLIEWMAGDELKQERVSAVIVAAPADRAATFCEGLTPEEAGFLASVTYTASIGVAFLTTRPFGDRVYGVAISPEESDLIAGVTFEQNKAPDRALELEGAAIAFLNDASSRALMGSSDEEVTGKAIVEMESFWPGFSSAVRQTFVFRCPRATPFFEVGAVRRLKGFLDRPSPTQDIYFCGDYLAGPHVEGAITSGLRAAEALIGSAGAR
jgi:protoporphyrinogen/coproporphyrinogen III oxidase